MTPLAEALTAAQRQARATLEKAYVADKIDKVELSRQISLVGLTDTVDGSFLLAALDVLKEWGVAAPNMTERVARENGAPEQASQKQLDYIAKLVKERAVEPPDSPLTKEQASEVITQLQDGTYDAAKWALPF